MTLNKAVKLPFFCSQEIRPTLTPNAWKVTFAPVIHLIKVSYFLANDGKFWT